MIKKVLMGLAFCLMVGFASAVEITMKTVSAENPCSLEKTLYFSNCRLSSLQYLEANCFQKFGGITDNRLYKTGDAPLSNAGYFSNSGFYLFQNDGSVATVEFHGLNSYGSYKGIGNGFLLRLTQEGADIYGQIVWHVGSTGMAQLQTDSWSGKAGTGNFESPETTVQTYATYCSDLSAVFAQYTGSCVVSFVDTEGALLGTIEVEAESSLSPDDFPEPPVKEGYVFKEWSGETAFIVKDETIVAVYAKKHAVTFVDADGSVIDTQSVVDGGSATAPDMTGKTYNGVAFSGWDQDCSNVSSDLTIKACYNVVPEYVKNAIDSGLVTDSDLLWGVNSGNWDGTSANWYTSGALESRWIPGKRAIFLNDAQITVVGEQRCSGMTIGTEGGSTSVNFTGGTIVADANATVILNGQIVSFASDISASGALTLNCSYIDKSIFVYAEPIEFEEKLMFPGAKISEISDLTFHMKGKFGGSYTVKDISCDIGSDGSGIHFYKVNGNQITGQAKLKTFGSYGGVWQVIKFVLTEKADGVYGYAEYACGGTGDGGWTPDVDMDEVEPGKRPNTAKSLVTGAEDDASAWNAAGVYACAIYKITYKSNAIDTQFPEVKISGNLSTAGKLTVTENTILRITGTGTLGTEGVFSQTLEGAGNVVFESSAVQKITGLRNITGYFLVGKEAKNLTIDASDAGTWTDFRIEGKVAVNGYSALPIVEDAPGTTVLPGGELEMQSFLYNYGPNSGYAPINVHTNGVLRYTRDWGMGRSKPIYMVGGKIEESTTGLKQLVCKLYLRDGATYSGSVAYMGDRDNYGWSFIDVGGSVPSSFNAASLVLGLNKPAISNRPLGAKFIVADVTGDEATDLTLNSVISESDSGLCESANRQYCGFWKTGSGTLELTAAGSCATSGVFKIDAGAIRLAQGASGEYGALVLEGNAEIDCKGGSIAFDASDSFAWNDDAVLTISGLLGRRTVRFGQDAVALSESQLSRIKYKAEDGSLVALKLTSDGYLSRASSGLYMFVR